MILIGISGLKTAGKDTAYRLLREQLKDEGLRVERAAFADKLKIMAARALGFDRPDEELIALMDSFKESAVINVDYRELDGAETLHTLTGREYLQHFGGRAREVFGENFWVDQVLPQPRRYTSSNEISKAAGSVEVGLRYYDADVLCITDVRYPNEAQRIKDLGGSVWEVVRPGLEPDGHSSEVPLSETLVDRKIINDSDFVALRHRVVGAIQEVS